MSMAMFINPGTGYAREATRENARDNMRVFLDDAGFKSDFILLEPNVGDDCGRFDFHVQRGDAVCRVSMPGLPLEKVRYTGKGQNIWNYPRLYVDGSSWVWLFAVDMMRTSLPGVPIFDGSIQENK